MIKPEDLAKSGSEHGNQAAIFAWAALNMQKYPDLKWLFAIPNGGARDKRTGANLKAEGVKPGIPDMHLMVRRGEFPGLWIELKVGKNKASNKQNEWLDQAQSCGHGAVVCYGWIEARDILVQYLNWGK